MRDDLRSPSAEVVALQQLCSLVNLFVRKHEIVAVIPTATPLVIRCRPGGK
jgi:hypothetical protein